MSAMNHIPNDQYLLPNQQYYYPPFIVNMPLRFIPELGQRKRPKYTRTTTGCLTCRTKKVKCDETKPNCRRCTDGSRSCSWPKGGPARKRSTCRQDITNGQPSTTYSPGVPNATTVNSEEHISCPYSSYSNSYPADRSDVPGTFFVSPYSLCCPQVASAVSAPEPSLANKPEFRCQRKHSLQPLNELDTSVSGL